MEKIVNIYRSLAQIPTLLEAKLSSNGNLVYSIWSQRNLENGKSVKFLRNILLNSNFTVNTQVQPADVSNESLSSISPSEKYKAVLKEADDKQYLEIWQQHNLYRTVDLNALDLHGKIYTDGNFKSFDWSPNESKLLYIAEKKNKESEAFYRRKASKKDDNSDKKNTPGQEYTYQQDWGEQMVGKKSSVIVEYSVEDDTANIIESLPDNVCPGQVRYSPCGNFIVGVSYINVPRKLGLIYCTNRESVIFKISQEGHYEIISCKGKASRFPIFTADGKSLLYFEREAKGPHHAAVALLKKDISSSTPNEVKTIVEIVQEEMEIDCGKKFYGLFNMGPPTRCWASGNRLILSTYQKNTIDSYVIDIDSGKITQLPYDDDGSLIVLDVHNDVILASYRNFFSQDILVIGKLPSKGFENEISWFKLTSSIKINNPDNFKYEYLELSQNNDDSIKNFSAIYVGPSSGTEKSVPLIVYPHGGPHSAFANNFSLDVSFSLSNGFAVLLINFRGSIGAGDKSVHFLLGKVGISDVSDCVLATNKALEKYPWLDSTKLALCGGSHGGFLVTHLSGQYPDLFKAVVARNPVIDVASMSIFSDIPDWCFAECGGDYTQIGQVDDELMLKMRKQSPIEHAHKVKAATMLQIGSNDLRVPPGQSFDYYHRLKANGVKVQMHLYDDNHPLGQVKNEMDNLINTILWLNDHINN